MSSFDRLLARAMQQPAAPDAPCPAPETLAAYLEGALTRTEHDAVEHHASRCPRCAQHLAALVQLDDQLAAGADRHAARRWRRWPWLVPAAAALVAAVVWTAVPNRDMTVFPPAKPSATPIAVPADRPTREEPPPSAGAPQETRPQGERRALDRTAPAASSPSLEGAPASSAAGVAARAAAPSAPAPMLDARQPAPKTLAQSPPPAMNEVVGRADVAPAPPLPEATPAEPDRAAAGALRKDKAGPPAETERSSARDRRAEDRPAQVVAQDAIAAAPGAAAKAPARPSREEAGFAPTLVAIPSPDARVAWRVRGVTVERTTDGGQTWRAETVASLAGPVVGSAPSADICWLGGANGVVLRREADGRWTQVSAPTSDRIVAITATSAASATVTTAGGRTLTTTDGGRTWAEPR